LSRAERIGARSIDAKIILWLKYFGRWNGAALWRAFAATGMGVSSALLRLRRFEDRHAHL
jgi:hypothetical protein